MRSIFRSARVLNANINSAAARGRENTASLSGFHRYSASGAAALSAGTQVATRRTSSGSSSYHAFQTKLQKRFASGVNILMSYTFSKLMTDIPASLEQLPASQIQDAGNRRVEWAIAPFDTPQNFWFSAIYEFLSALESLSQSERSGSPPPGRLVHFHGIELSKRIAIARHTE